MTKSQEKNILMNGTFDAVADHYSAISKHYDDWFSMPWPQPAIRQGEALNSIIHQASLPARSRVLDLTCGIGTQAFGLALKGHDVTAVDISEGQLDEARRRAIHPDGTPASIKWVLGNAAHIADAVTGPFDLIISFGNSFPLLGDIETIKQSLSQCRDLLAPHGIILISMRDHAALRAQKPYVVGSGKLYDTSRPGVWIETAEWLPDGLRYKSNIVFITTAPVHEHCHYSFPPLAALTADEMLDLMRSCGFSDVTLWPQADNPAFSFPIFKGVKA